MLAISDHQIGNMKSATNPRTMKTIQKTFFSMTAFYSPAFLSLGKRIKRGA
jgi:hypothetical protein